MRCPVTISNCSGTAIIDVSTNGTVLIAGKGATGLGDGGDWVFASMAWVVHA